MAEKVIAHCGGSVEGMTIGMLGLTFKPNTDDMRDAPSLAIIPVLQQGGATIRAYDPEGMTEARRLLDNQVVWCNDTYEAIEGTDCLVIVTEWNSFRNLDLACIKRLMKRPRMVDLRNIYKPEMMAEQGIDYISVGRPAPAGG